MLVDWRRITRLTHSEQPIHLLSTSLVRLFIFSARGSIFLGIKDFEQINKNANSFEELWTKNALFLSSCHEGILVKTKKKTWFCISLSDHCEAEWYNGFPAERHTGKPRAKIIQDKMGIGGPITIWLPSPRSKGHLGKRNEWKPGCSYTKVWRMSKLCHLPYNVAGHDCLFYWQSDTDVTLWIPTQSNFKATFWG